MRKLTHELVEERFREQGCKLLSPYINKRTKVKYECHCGNISNITPADFNLGRRCGCGIKEQGTRRRHKITKIKEIFSKQGCALLEENYKNNKQPMSYICVCGRESKICLSSFMQGRRCFECGKDKHRRPLAALNLLLKRKCSTALRETFKATGQRKNTKSRALLGYGVVELRERITNHPNWEKVKDKKWHLDHIFPIKAFTEHGITDPKLINSLDNLQPLSAKDNLIKKDNYDEAHFLEWLKIKQVKTL
jgi:hypothetical protein